LSGQATFEPVGTTALLEPRGAIGHDACSARTRAPQRPRMRPTDAGRGGTREHIDTTRRSFPVTRVSSVKTSRECKSSRPAAGAKVLKR